MNGDLPREVKSCLKSRIKNQVSASLRGVDTLLRITREDGEREDGEKECRRTYSLPLEVKRVEETTEKNEWKGRWVRINRRTCRRDPNTASCARRRIGVEPSLGRKSEKSEKDRRWRPSLLTRACWSSRSGKLQLCSSRGEAKAGDGFVNS